MECIVEVGILCVGVRDGAWHFNVHTYLAQVVSEMFGTTSSTLELSNEPTRSVDPTMAIRFCLTCFGQTRVAGWLCQ